MKKRPSSIEDQQTVEVQAKKAETPGEPAINQNTLKALRTKLVVDDGSERWGKLEDFSLNTLRGLTFDQAILRYPQLLAIMEDVLLQVSAMIPTDLEAEIRQEEEADQAAHEFAQLLKNAGKWFSRNGHQNLALKAFEGALKFLSDDGELHVALADIYYEMENYNHASAAYQQALKCLPDNPAVKRKLADIQVKMAEFHFSRNSAEAVKFYEIALQYIPNYIPALCGLGDIAFFDKDFDIAQEFFERVLDIDSSCVRALVALGNVHFAQHDDDEAESLYHEAIMKNPIYLSALYDMAYFQFHCRKKYSCARNYLDRALKLSPDNVTIMMLKIEIAMKTKDFDTAQTMVELVLRQDPSNKKAYEYYCRLFNGECFISDQYVSLSKAVKPGRQSLSRDFYFSLQYANDPRDEGQWEKYLIRISKEHYDKFSKFKSESDGRALN